MGKSLLCQHRCSRGSTLEMVSTVRPLVDEIVRVVHYMERRAAVDVRLRVCPEALSLLFIGAARRSERSAVGYCGSAVPSLRLSPRTLVLSMASAPSAIGVGSLPAPSCRLVSMAHKARCRSDVAADGSSSSGPSVSAMVSMSEVTLVPKHA